MTNGDLLALLPLLVVAGGAVVLMLAICVRRSARVASSLTLMALAAALAAVVPAARHAPRQVTPLLVADSYGFFFQSLVLCGASAATLLSVAYLARRERDREEYYLLLLLATLGAMTLCLSAHFATLFLGLEILSVSLYALIAYPREGGTRPLEAGVKYLVLAATSSAFLLFGMALVYAETGTLDLFRFSSIAGAAGGRPPALMAGMALMVVGIGFKLAVVPFHMWTPDVYEGAPAPVAAYVATVSKAAVFSVLLRFFVGAGLSGVRPMHAAFAAIAVASMLAGNLLALLQDNVKRILAYSSIANLGYLLVAFQAGDGIGVEAAGFFLAAYFATTFLAFGVVTVLSAGDRDADTVAVYRGLHRRRPVLAGLFAFALFSLAGIPVTAGFVGKVYVLSAGVAGALWPQVAALVAGSAIGLFYYLRVVTAMYASSPETEEREGEAVPLAPSGGLALAVLAALLLAMGLWPGPLVAAIRVAVARLT